MPTFFRLASRSRMFVAFFAAALLAVGASKAQTANAALPPEFADWDQFIDEQLKLWKVPGASIALVKDGKIISVRGHGFRDAERKLPMTGDTVQPIASVTKSFTVASLATLVRDGKIEWDKPVRDYLPDFRLHADYATNTVTVRDLVTHRSGLPRHDFAWFGSTRTREELFKRLRHFELSAEPRARFQYNNFMYMTAGYLGGKAAGSDWETLVRKNVFEPLNMHSSSFAVADLKRMPDYATGYQFDNDDNAKPKAYQELVAMGPTGSINSNARDMANYLSMYANGGVFDGKTIIAPNDYRAMTTGQMTLPDSRLWVERAGPQYGMGLFTVNYRGVTLVDHGGNMPGASTAFAFIPGRGIGVYTTVNMSGSFLRDVIMYAAIDRLLGMKPVDWSARFRDVYEKNKASQKAALAQKVTPKRLGTKPSFALDEYVGEYEHEGYGIVTIGSKENQLTIGYNGFTAPLPHLHLDVFQSPKDELSEFDETRVQFMTNFDGDLTGLRTEFESAVKPIEFRRLPDKTFKDPKFLSQFVGTYAISVREYQIVLRPDNVLTLVTRIGAPRELIGVRGRKFNVKDVAGFSIEFTPDPANPNGPITQLVLNQSGTSAIALRKP
jgi:CubicO group peptidase (beta-lactamase class C family)